MSVSTHVLDSVVGRPAAGIAVRLFAGEDLVAEGLTDRGIAERLWLSPKTIESHVRHILQKLGLPEDHNRNRRVAAVLAYLHR